MANEDSHIPIVEAGYKSTSSSDYQKVLEYIPQPDKLARIHRIEFDVDSTGLASGYVKLTINGVVMFEDLLLANSSVLRVIDFGGDLKLRPAVETGIKFYVKSNGTTNVKTTCIISGIEVPLK
jgi:hypothetical protein